jgi:hypothetical protein
MLKMIREKIVEEIESYVHKKFYVHTMTKRNIMSSFLGTIKGLHQ